MFRFDQTLSAWGTAEFEAVFKREVAALGANQLPLQQGLCGSSSVADEPFTAVILNVAEQEQTLNVKAGIFYQGVIGGCSCADDPTPDNTLNEYCELLFVIDKTSAATTVTLIEEAEQT